MFLSFVKPYSREIFTISIIIIDRSIQNRSEIKKEGEEGGGFVRKVKVSRKKSDNGK